MIDIGAYQSGATSFAPIAPPVLTVTIPTSSTTSSSAVTPVVTGTVTTPAVSSTPVVSTPAVTQKTAKGEGIKLKVTSRKAHPGGGSATKFHKAADVKANKHAAIAKGHPAAHGKKK